MQTPNFQYNHERVEKEGRYINGLVEIGGSRCEMSLHVVNGVALIEGDIIVATEQEVESKLNTPEGLLITVDKGKRWPDGIVNYMIEANFPDEQRIADAIDDWENSTFIRFREVTDPSTNHVFFRNVTNGCSSHVGMQGNGRQDINLSPNCPAGTVIHEIGHALGLWHEHTRGDRDHHIQVHIDNVEQGQEHNFQIHRTDGIIHGTYDYRSIMHYGNTAFGNVVNGVRQETITVLDINRPPIGQRERLSSGDIAAINDTYFPDRIPPCTSSPCGLADVIELPDVLPILFNEPYRSDLDINGEYITDEQIIKVHNLNVGSAGAEFLFELNEDPRIHHPYKAIIIENLNLQSTHAGSHELRFGYDTSNLFDVISGLRAQDQTEVPPANVGYGANGFDGYPGAKGRTKNSPTFFLFIKTITIAEGNIDNLSMRVDLEGLPGGPGGDGGVGGDGNPGAQGRSARNGDFGSCKRGNGVGGRGGAPGRGGRGGDAGCGGDGSNVHLFFDDVEMWNVIDRSVFNLDGFFEERSELSRPGDPGDAGKPGTGGPAGTTAGNCTPRTRSGPDGMPKKNTEPWRNWNLGRGSIGVSGKDGVVNDEALDETSNLVFFDPTSNP